MRIYRRSPFHPHLGKALGRLLWAVTRTRPAIVDKTLRGGLRFRLHLDEVIDSSLYYSGTFEIDAERCIEGALSSGRVAIDIGANVGYHSLRMARSVGPSGKVIAIEPTSRAIERLKVNAGLNEVPALQIVKVALGERDAGNEVLTFKSSYRLDGKSMDVPESVRVVTLDTLLGELGVNRVDFIKCDVDGFEGKVMRGSLRTLHRDRPRLFLEVTPGEMRRLGDEPDELFTTLEAIGYRFSTEGGSPISDWKSFLARLGSTSSVNLNVVADENN